MKTNFETLSIGKLTDFNVIELKKEELSQTDGGVWGFIAPISYLVLGSAVVGAFGAGLIVGYVGYKIYKHYAE